jgi:hypothetical protein
MKECGTNRVYATVMLPNAESKWLSGKQCYGILNWVCKEGTTVAIDELRKSGILHRTAEQQFINGTVNHSLGQFSTGNGIHLNTIENCWNPYIGTHHHYYVKYLPGFRQSNRGNDRMCVRPPAWAVREEYGMTTLGAGER